MSVHRKGRKAKVRYNDRANRGMMASYLIEACNRNFLKALIVEKVDQHELASDDEAIELAKEVQREGRYDVVSAWKLIEEVRATFDPSRLR